MKNIMAIGLLSVIMAFISVSCGDSGNGAEQQTGVWVGDDAELLMTDKVMMYFEKQPDGDVVAMVRVDSVAEDCARVSRDTIVRSSIPEEFNIKYLTGGEVEVNGHKLTKAEDVRMCSPYDMSFAVDSSSIADRLTEWRMGVTVGYDNESKDIVVEANTPSNMFIYYILNGMYYLRAARIKNVNEGTLFYQNIRVMKNPNTMENTLYFSPNNKEEVLNDLKINMDGFNPDACYFDPNGGIYWSYVSHTPDQIILNGCSGDTYYINRRVADDENVFEWIGFTSDK